jgi:hypothetical protein
LNDEPDKQAPPPIGWAILELMGHRRLAGHVTEVQVAGAGMLRLDVPGEQTGDAVATQFYSPSAVYCITPCTEELARRAARLCRPAPVHRYELPAPTPVTAPVGDVEDADPDDDPPY